MVEKVPSLKGGGAFWFVDLTTPDDLYIFPVLSALTFLATVEFNMQEGMEDNPMADTMKNFSRVLGVLTVPFTANFPKAIFCYWVTSNLFSLLYGIVLRQPPVRTFLDLPPLITQSAPSKPPVFSFFAKPNTLAPAASSLIAGQPERPRASARRVTSSAAISQRIKNLEKILKARNKKRR